jgi:O-antigen/teichoic acid export membrane protein
MALDVSVARESAASISDQPGANRLVRNVAMLAGSQVATWTFTFAWTLFIPRAIGPHGIGQIQIAWSTTAILNVIIGLGIDVLLTKEIAVDRSRASRLVSTAMLVRLSLAIPALLAMAAYLNLVHFDPRQSLLIWIATLGMLLNFLTATIQAALWGLERMEFQAYTKVLSYGVVVPVSILLVLMKFGVVALITLELVVAVIGLTVNLWWRRPFFRLDWRIDLAAARTLVRNSLVYWLGGLAFSIYLWIDSVMLSVMTSATVVGWYAIPTQLFATEMFIPIILSQAWFPRLAAALRDGPERLRAIARPALELVLVLSLPISAGAILVARPVIHTLFGLAFSGSIPSLIILSVALPMTYLNIMANQVVIAANRQMAWTKLMAVAAVLNPLLNFFAIGYFQRQFHNGATGAALSLLATEIFQAAVAIRLMPGILNAGSVRKLARAGLATLGMSALVWVIGPLGLLAQIAAGALSFAGLALALRVLTHDELELLRAIADRVRSKLTARLHGGGAPA